jgi:hypothetical protein
MLKLEKWKCKLIIASSLILTLLFIKHHHKKPKNAYTDVYKSGSLQRMMPFEKTQSSLVPYFPYDKYINLDLIPKKPSFYKTRENPLYYDTQSDTLKQKDRINIYNNIFVKDDDSSLLITTTVNEVTFFVNRGFYKSESTHIWSRKEAKMLVPNNSQTVNITLKSYPESNKIKITANGEITEITPTTETTLSYDMKQISRNWLIIEFSAEKSATPSDTNSTNHDNRDLSFSVSINEII